VDARCGVVRREAGPAILDLGPCERFAARRASLTELDHKVRNAVPSSSFLSGTVTAISSGVIAVGADGRR
jgi:hypothetical protein